MGASLLRRDYGDKESKIIENTVGNIFLVRWFQKQLNTFRLFRKGLTKTESITINRNNKSISISTQMDSLIPPSKISNLTQGMFVDAVSDNFDERIKQKIFHAELVMDSAKVSAEMKTYKKIPVIAEFIDSDGKDILHGTIESNYHRGK